MLKKIRLYGCITAISSLLSTTALAQDKPGIKVIEPDKKVPSAQVAARDTEKFEIGASIGYLSVEDFDSNVSLGLAFRYYLKPSIFFELSTGSATTNRSNFEGDADFNPERDFTYTSLLAGYQFLKGRSFLGAKRKFNSGLFVIGGLDLVDFADESNTGILLGFSYKTIFTDWLSINIDFKNHIVDRDFVGDSKLTQNGELVFGINTFF